MLRELREKAGLTQAELAHKIGYTSPQFISNIERGVSSLPPSKFKRISKLLDVRIEKLISFHVSEIEDRLNDKFGGY